MKRFHMVVTIVCGALLFGCGDIIDRDDSKKGNSRALLNGIYGAWKLSSVKNEDEITEEDENYSRFLEFKNDKTLTAYTYCKSADIIVQTTSAARFNYEKIDVLEATTASASSSKKCVATLDKGSMSYTMKGETLEIKSHDDRLVYARPSQMEIQRLALEEIPTTIPRGDKIISDRARLDRSTWELDASSEEYGLKSGERDLLNVNLTTLPYTFNRTLECQGESHTAKATIDISDKNVIDILQAKTDAGTHCSAQLNKVSFNFRFPTQHKLEFFKGDKILATYVMVD